MRKTIFLITLCAFLFGLPTIGQAQAVSEKVYVKIDGKEINFDVPPMIENGRTLVPLRAIFEALGAQVSYNNQSNTVIANKEKIEVILPIGKPQATVNGKVYNLEVPPRINKGRTFVPLRFISEALGATVSWDELSNAVIITSQHEIKMESNTTSKEPSIWTIVPADDPYNKNLLYYLNGRVSSKVYCNQNVSYVNIVTNAVYSTVYIPSKHFPDFEIGDEADITYTGIKDVKNIDLLKPDGKKFGFSSDTRADNIRLYKELPKSDLKETLPNVHVTLPPNYPKNSPNYKIISGVVESVGPTDLKLVGDETIYVDYTGRNLFVGVHVGDKVEISLSKREGTEIWDFAGFGVLHPEFLPPDNSASTAKQQP